MIWMRLALQWPRIYERLCSINPCRAPPSAPKSHITKQRGPPCAVVIFSLPCPPRL
jgi:hypothetical protein